MATNSYVSLNRRDTEFERELNAGVVTLQSDLEANAPDWSTRDEYAVYIRYMEAVASVVRAYDAYCRQNAVTVDPTTFLYSQPWSVMESLNL